MIKFVKDILERFDVSKDGTHVAAITYSTDTNLHFRFNTIKGKNRLAEAKILLNDMRHLRGYTFPYKALQLANKELFSSRGGIRHEAKKVKKHQDNFLQFSKLKTIGIAIPGDCRHFSLSYF